jgi:uncharacterized membrane protein YecN with MAPEG domain
MMPIVSALYAGLLGLLVVALGLHVVGRRRSARIGIGDGDDMVLRHRVRVHGNAAENVPLALVLLTLCELTGTSAPILHVLGVTLLVARALHAWGLSRSAGVSVGRFVGVFGSWGAMIAMALILLARYAMHA